MATQTITVNDSTPTVTGATFIKDAKVTTTEETAVLKVSGLTFTSTASEVKFADGKITNLDGSVTYGTYDLVSNIEGTTAVVTESGELALKVTQTKGAEVSGTVSVRIKDNAGKTVAVAPIEVSIAKATVSNANVVLNDGDGVTTVTNPQVGNVLNANIILSNDDVIYNYPLDAKAKYKWFYKENGQELGTAASYTVTSDNVDKTLALEVTYEGLEGKATWEASAAVIPAD